MSDMRLKKKKLAGMILLFLCLSACTTTKDYTVQGEIILPPIKTTSISLEEPSVEKTEPIFGKKLASNKIKWYMSRSEVQEILGDAILKDGSLYQITTACGLDAVNIFKFDSNGELNQVFISFSTEYISTRPYIMDYIRVKKALTTKYGAPTEDTNLENSMALDDLETAIMFDNVALYSEWELENMRITLLYAKRDIMNDTFGACYEALDYIAPINTDGI